MLSPRKHIAGFSLIQISILLTVAGLVMVAVLPTPQGTVKTNASSASKMNSVLTALRQYQAATCTLPCPADPTLAMGHSNWGKAAANPGTGSPGNCISGSPAAAYADTTNHIAIGMVPVFTIGLSADYALDGWGRNLTYAVDTNATPTNWSSLSLPGAITVNDNGSVHNSVLALVSHGQDGFGAWLPLQGNSGTASRLNNGSTDANQAANAQVTAGTLTPNTTFTSFVNQNQTTTFDDQVAYSNPQWNLNAVPRIDQGTISPPANGTYAAPQTLTFSITSPQILTVTGTPQLDLSALSGGSIGTSNKAYATYASGSCSHTLTFTYQIQSSDNAPNGLALTTPVDLNGGSIFPCLPFNTPDLSQVKIINGNLWVADMGNNRVLELTTGGTFVMGLGSSYNGDTHAVGSSGSSVLRFNTPTDVKVDSSGNIWVADSHNYRVLKYNNSGQWLMTIGGAAGDTCAGTYVNSTTCANIPGHTACCAPNASSCTCNYGSATGQFDTNFGSAQQMSFDTSGNLWITDYNNNRVQEFNPNTGQYLGGFTKASSCPSGLAIDNNNTIWLSGDCTNAVYKCTTAGSCTKVNSVSLGCNQCTDYVTFDPSSGTVWANDQSGNVQKFNSSGTYLGLWSNSHTTNLAGIYYDSNGNIWIADDTSANNIYKIDPNTGNILLTIGTGASGNGTNPVAFKHPQNMFLSSR